MINFIIFLFIIITSSYISAMQTAIQYGKAITQTHAANWDMAQTSINELLVNQSDRPDLLYDAGVVAYRLKEYQQAQAYFEHVTAQSNISMDLKEQAYFNLGNAHVQQKQLEDAVVAYEKTLEINPDNERAQHNLDLVKQMLEQQQEQQKDQDKQGQDEENKEQEEQQGDDSHEQQQNQQQQKQENGSQDNKDQNNQESDNNAQDQQQNSDDGNEAQDSSKQDGQQQKQADNAEDQEQEGREQEEQLEQGADQHAADQEQGENGTDQHEESPEQQSESKNGNDIKDQQQDKTEVDGEQASVEQEEKDKQKDKAQVEEATQAQEQPLDPKDRFIQMVLQQQEDADAHANKRMIKRAIDKNLAGQHGQNRW